VDGGNMVVGDRNYTIAVAVNNTETLLNNLFLSPGLQEGHKHQILIKENFLSASEAYNSAIDEASHEIIIFIHQDIYLPENWFTDLGQSLSYLEEKQLNWGVLGCFGVTKTEQGVGSVCDPWGVHGREIINPESVETLDEIVLIIRKSSGLRFDPLMPHFHLYGTDICMSSKEKGMNNFAFKGFCIHNTHQLLILPQEFYDCYFYLKKKWAKYLPIQTSCIRITTYNEKVYYRQFREWTDRVLGIKQTPKLRLEDPRLVLFNAHNNK